MLLIVSSRGPSVGSDSPMTMASMNWASGIGLEVTQRPPAITSGQSSVLSAALGSMPERRIIFRAFT